MSSAQMSGTEETAQKAAANETECPCRQLADDEAMENSNPLVVRQRKLRMIHSTHRARMSPTHEEASKK